MRNNLSFQTFNGRDTLNLGSSDIQFNSFTPNADMKVSADDFTSLDEALLTAPRQANGDLPVTGFLRLKPSSKLLGKGLDLGF